MKIITVAVFNLLLTFTIFATDSDNDDTIQMTAQRPLTTLSEEELKAKYFELLKQHNETGKSDEELWKQVADVPSHLLMRKHCARLSESPSRANGSCHLNTSQQDSPDATNRILCYSPLPQTTDKKNTTNQTEITGESITTEVSIFNATQYILDFTYNHPFIMIGTALVIGFIAGRKIAPSQPIINVWK